MSHENYDILISPVETEKYLKEHGLKKVLQGVHLWAIGVGATISGVYFGLIDGIEGVRPLDFLIGILLVTIFYIVLTMVFSELATFLPYAGGPYAYTRKGMGPLVGYMAGILTILEFLCASALLTIYIRIYFEHFLPLIPSNTSVIIIYVIFISIDIIGAKLGLYFQLVMAAVAISALIIFIMGVAASANIDNLIYNMTNSEKSGGIFKAISFGVMVYICIEGISLAAEETKYPNKSISFGFKASIITVMILSFSIFLFSAASVNLSSIEAGDNLLEAILFIVQPDDMVLITVFATLNIGILLASLHGLMYGFSRQLFSLSRAGYFPKLLSKLQKSSKTPYWAIIFSGVLAMLFSVEMSKTNLVSVMGVSASLMYILVLISYIRIDMAGSGAKNRIFIKKIIIWAALAFGIFVFGIFLINGYKYSIPIIAVLGIAIIHYVLRGKDLIVEDAPEEIEAKTKKIK